MRIGNPKQPGEIFHNTIFGQLIPVNVNNFHVERENDSRAIHVEREANSRAIHVERENDSRAIHVLDDEKARRIQVQFTNNTKNQQPLKAVFPEITSEAFALTMDKYRIYVSKLNEARKLENIEIEKHNSKVPAKQEDDVKETFANLFLRKYKSLLPVEYNEKVDEFFTDKGIILKKKKLHIIKYQSELVFQQFVYEYSQQLSQNTKVFKDMGIVENRPIKMLEINSLKIVMLQRNGISSIDVCKETIKNHRRNLVEAGILFDYTFCGHKRGIKAHINREILTVFDSHTGNLTTSENQHFTPQTAKSFGNNKEVTVTELNKSKIKENVHNISLIKGTASPDFNLNNNIDSNTIAQVEKSKLGGRAENVKFSEKLDNLIENEFDLCNNLASGKYNYYKPLDIRELYHESVSGTMSRERFKELIIQEFFKDAARLYRNSTPYFGSWKKAYDNWFNKKFLVNGNLYNKQLMVEKLQEYRWRLNHAHKWFTSKNVAPLYPNQYFDFSRNTAKEIGFEYTKKAYLSNKKSLENRITEEKQVIKAAKERKERINYSKKFDLAFNRFKNNRISLNEMLDYVKNNLPANYQMKFTERLREYATKR
jgi:hypothetical protein